ncbi:23432_t:CDS:1, partial [Gigaspora margarita]
SKYFSLSIIPINADSSSNSTQQSSNSIATGNIGLGFSLFALGACASAI